MRSLVASLTSRDNFKAVCKYANCVVAGLLLTVVLSMPLQAQAPYLVKDINTLTDLGGSYPSSFVQVGNQVFFVASFRGDGVQLWKTDGTSGATAAVTAQYFPLISSLTSSNGKVFFLAGDFAATELWVSDGSLEGTRMLKAVTSFPPSLMVDVNGTLFFVADTPAFGSGLWKSDGTVAGTVLVKDFGSSFDAALSGLTAVNGSLFMVTGNTYYGWTLWKSDGTEANTVALKAFLPGSPITVPSNFINVNGTLFFTAPDGGFSPAGVALWKSDGTDVGTVMLKTIVNASLESEVAELTNVNGTLFFRAVVDATNDTELWKSDGTVDGTVVVANICSGSCVSGMSYLTEVNGTLFFSAYQSLWKSDGTAEGTTAVANEISPTDIVSLNGQAVFAGQTTANGRELWKSDGTPAGTAMVSDICPGICSSVVPTRYSYLAAGLPTGVFGGSGSFVYSAFARPARSILSANGKVFFSANDSSHGSEPWTSDGGAGGTTMLKNIDIDTSSLVSNAADLNGTLLFGAYSGTERALWKTDGTEPGTALLNSVQAIGKFQAFNGALLFSGFDSTHGHQLWKTDGTDAGTIVLSNTDSVDPLGIVLSVPSIAVAGSAAYFVAADTVHGSELWKTDGTSTGTTLVKDIVPGVESSNPQNLTAVNGTLFFTAVNAAGSAAIWKSDGSASGTVMVKDFPPPVGDNCTSTTPSLCASLYAPRSLTAVNGKLFFTAYSEFNQGLWKSDGTAEGTFMVASGTVSSFAEMIDVNGTLFFLGFDGTNGFGLWKSDGTAQGTVEVKNFQSGLSTVSVSGQSGNLVNVNGTLYFTMNFASEPGLWKSDGTTAGTVEVKAVDASALSNINGALYFVGKDENGTELWRSDGSAQGTSMVADINPGVKGSRPIILAASRGRLFFSATDDSHGTELWALTIAPTSVSLRTSADAVAVNTAVTLTATVTPGAAGALTGIVNFKDGGVSLGTANVGGAGVATLTTAALSEGTHTLTAEYAGDSNNAESTSPAVTQLILAASPDYTLSATPDAMTLRAGASANFTITATADANFDGTVTISCGQLPKGVTCSFSPSASLAPTAGHAASTTLVISTTPQTVSANQVSGGPIMWASLGGVGVFGFMLLGSSNKIGTLLALTTLMVFVALSLTACGGGGGTSGPRPNPNGTPSGPAIVQVTATATAGTTGGNTSAHTLVLNLTIQ